MIARNRCKVELLPYCALVLLTPGIVLGQAPALTVGERYLERLKGLHEGRALLVAERQRQFDRRDEISTLIEIAPALRNPPRIASEIAQARLQVLELDCQLRGLPAESKLRIVEIKTRLARTERQLAALEKAAQPQGRQVRSNLSVMFSQLTTAEADLARCDVALSGLRPKIDDADNQFWRACDPFGRQSRATLIAAIELCNPWIEADAEHWGAILVRGVARRRLGQLSEARLDFATVAGSTSSLQAVALAARGELRGSEGREREAAADFSAAFKANRKDPRADLFHAATLLASGRSMLAENSLQSALRFAPGDADANRLLALMHADAGRPVLINGRKAVTYAEQACEASRDDWLCVAALASAQAADGDFAAAAATARRAADLADGENRDWCTAQAKAFQNQQLSQIKWDRLTAIGHDARGD